MWFGPRWDASVCDAGDEVAAPVGVGCLGCGEPIVMGDRGLSIPTVNEDGHAYMGAWHLDCLARNVGIDDLKVTRRVEKSG